MQRNGSKLHDKDLSDDICPVCKSNRYLNPKLEFFINPECYHKMCSTCVDRIFTSGPTSCPVPYCGKTLRKRGFHKAFFGDLKVEREVDIRKRVDAVFNRRQEEFETLRDWNNYLEEVESLIFDLIEGTKEEKMKAEERLRKYREINLHEIDHNRREGLKIVEMEKRREKAEKEAIRLRRIDALQEAEEAKRDLWLSHNEMIERLATTDEDATKITTRAPKVILKKSSAVRNLNEPNSSDSNSYLSEGLTIRGLKKKQVKADEEPYDPFGGKDLKPSRYVLQDDYECEWLTPARNDDGHLAGGYNFHQYYSRTLYEAFSGMGVFIQDETKLISRPGFDDTEGTAKDENSASIL
ncbi:RNA polymerase II transcription factor B subunit 3 [Golovinomyces cichoracearum]|uniref:RNA polymerase II transcription factor B subunit 3 n=1 Tax=Golovinomyces cichoracearum TaxID=62708 RepID=A0A420HDR6_9PEZI|nr:RNA polymerase II transcription factor B subunit 3 [Golovinomyces cichoracearum]